MPVISTSGIAGTDGVVPVYNPQATFKFWSTNDVFQGGVGLNKYVPNINDFVVDTQLLTMYRVDAINPTTLVPTLTEITWPIQSTSISDTDILTGVGPGTQSDTYRVYLDTSVVPYILAVDARLKVGGTMCSYCKIFLGADISNTGTVISFLYDSGGNVLSQNIPLELVALNSLTNYAIKTVSVAYTNQALPDGELVTAVFYSATGNEVSRRQLLIENTSFVRTTASDQKYVTGISLHSPFLSTTSNTLLEYPLNVPVDALNMIGVVQYSDGSTLELPVDGAKFKMLGIDNYLSSVVGQKVDLVLSYTLGSSELAVGGVSSDGKYVTAPYQLTTLAQNGAYNVKLFAYPQWIDAVNGYSIRWFLYNMDRNAHYEVTGLISYSGTSPAFQPLAYGLQQNLIPRINLADVSSMFSSYIHVQPIYIVLRAPGNQTVTNWTVNSTPGDGIDYGVNIHCRVHDLGSGVTGLKVDSDFPDQNTWLSNLYTQSKPLYDPRREVAAPTPNYFVVQIGTTSYAYPIASWNQVLSIPSAIPVSSTLEIRFISRSVSGDLDLSVAGLPVWTY